MDRLAKGSGTPLETLQARVHRFAEEAAAEQVIVLNLSGHLLAATDTTTTETDSVAMGALLAGTFASARRLATMFGEDDFRALFHQGARMSIYTLLIEDQWLLVTAFDRQTQVGMVRILAAQVATEIGALLVAFDGEAENARATIQSQGFQASFDDTIDRLFADES